MYRYQTKLLLAGVVAVVLTVAPAQAFHKGVVHGGGGGGPGESIQTLDGLDCAEDEIAKLDNGTWICAADDTGGGGGGGSKTVFVTSESFTADLRSEGMAPTGLRGGDELCQAAAENGIVPPGQYIALLSNSDKDAIDRLPANPDGYFLPNGVKVADDTAALFDTATVSLLASIDIDEFGNSILQEDVWTGTLVDGTFSGNACDDWSNSESTFNFFGLFGLSDETGEAWLNESPGICGLTSHLYCVQR